MAKSTLKDVYGNRAFERVQTSAANTITFEQIQFGVGLFQGVAMVISRVEWFPTSIGELLLAADRLQVALTNRDDLTSLNALSQNVLVLKELKCAQVGAVVSLTLNESPYVSDLSTLPGGGLILPANPLYIAIDTEGYADATGVEAVLYLTIKALADAEYIELVQTIMPANF